MLVGFCGLVACLTSQQHASVSQGLVCTDDGTFCYIQIEVADEICPLTFVNFNSSGRAGDCKWVVVAVVVVVVVVVAVVVACGLVACLTSLQHASASLYAMTMLCDFILQAAVTTAGAVDVTNDVDTAVRGKCVTK